MLKIYRTGTQEEATLQLLIVKMLISIRPTKAKCLSNHNLYCCRLHMIVLSYFPKIKREAIPGKEEIFYFPAV